MRGWDGEKGREGLGEVGDEVPLPLLPLALRGKEGAGQNPLAAAHAADTIVRSNVPTDRGEEEGEGGERGETEAEKAAMKTFPHFFRQKSCRAT